MGLRLRLTALIGSLFFCQRAHNGMAALVLLKFQLLQAFEANRLQLHFLLWFILNPVVQSSTRVNVKTRKMTFSYYAGSADFLFVPVN